jgi:hypothetical protein
MGGVSVFSRPLQSLIGFSSRGSIDAPEPAV